jgi:hypothetical protein
MYKADVCAPPRRAAGFLELLLDCNHSLVMRPVGKRQIPTVRIHPWPSWLTKGNPKVVDFFLKFFYLGELTEFERVPGKCPLCNSEITGPFWEHAL